MLCYIIFNVRQESSSETCLQKFNQFQYYANCCASNRCKRTWIPRIQRPVSLERADNPVVYNSSELPPKTTSHIPVNGTLKATQRKPIVCNKRTTQCLFSLKLLERDIEKSPVWFFFSKLNASANLQLPQLQVTVITNSSTLPKYYKNYRFLSAQNVLLLSSLEMSRHFSTFLHLLLLSTFKRKHLAGKTKQNPPHLLPSHKLRLFLSFIQLILRLGLLSWQYDQKSWWENEWFPQRKFPQTSQLLFVHLTFSGKGNTGNIQVKWGCLTSGLGSCKYH